MLRAQNRHHLDWSADYRFYSQDRFDEDAVFDQVRSQIQTRLPDNQPLVAAMDDSLLRKTGRKIHGVRFLRDPLARPSKSISCADCACCKSPPPCLKVRAGRA